MNRRDVLKLGTAFGVASAIPDMALAAPDMAQEAMPEPDAIGMDELFQNINAHSYLNFEHIMAPLDQSAYAKFTQEYFEGQITSEAELLIASSDLIPNMQAITAEYYNNFEYIDDQVQYGVREDIRPAQPIDDVAEGRMKWAGDCDDFGLGLMIEFNQRLGIDFSSMSLVAVDPHDPSGALHAMLLVRTDAGDMLFNNDGTGKFADEYDNITLLQAQSLNNKAVWQKVSLAEPGVEPIMEIVPEYTDEMLKASNAEETPEAPVPHSRPKGIDF